MSNTQNPLLETFNTPFDTPPFEKFMPEHYLPAIKEAIEISRKQTDAIVANKEEPTFENTIVAMDKGGEQLGLISNVLFNLNSAETSDELQAVTRDASPILSEYSNEVWQNQELFQRVQKVYAQKESLDLDNEGQMLLEKTYKGFIRNGASLDAKAQERFKEISMELAQLTLQFGENVLAETNEYELLIENEKDLSGLPDMIVAQAAETAKAKNQEGKWIFTLQAPSYIPFMENADNRELREKLYRAYMSKANKGDDRDNKEVIRKVVALRTELAQILGYNSFAEYTLEERMAGTPDTVLSFLKDLLDKAKPKAQEEVEELKEFVKESGDDIELQRWDWAYYSEKLKKKKYSIDDELLRPYFKLENVLNGVFLTAEKLYNISFKKLDNVPVYHEDVEVYEVVDTEGNHVSVFYADFHPREGKRGGAWMTSYRSQEVRDGIDVRPLVSIVCNFTPSTPDNPSLLTFNEVLTLFHEFGHALHGMLANSKYSSLSGTSVYWDFVELPSQIFENWCYEKECLDLFAEHYETGEKIPQEYIDKIKASSTYHEAYATVRQLSFGFLDMTWFNQSLEDVHALSDLSKFEEDAMSATELFPKVEGTMMSTQFSHIFAGGYGAGYYSYKWAEVLDADAFSMFKENGIFDKATATSFKENVLSKGGSEHPMELYKKFRGREPKVDALLERAGLV